jgi:hypothetical protein
MIAKALDWIRDQLQPSILEVGGKKFSNKGFAEVKPDMPLLAKRPALVKVSTLQGFADLVRVKMDGVAQQVSGDGVWPLPFFDYKDAIIQVESETKVELFAKTTGVDGNRARLIEASPVPFERFPFGTWLSQEEFVIAVASRFADTDDKAEVLKIAGSLTTDASQTSEDDGFTQKATIKAGMKVPETVTVKGMVELAPYRTFPEVRQVISKFVFRAKPGEKPQLMLMEADGGSWKIDAINEIRRSLAVFDLGIDIVA